MLLVIGRTLIRYVILSSFLVVGQATNNNFGRLFFISLEKEFVNTYRHLNCYLTNTMSTWLQTGTG